MTKGKVSYIQKDVAEKLLEEWAPIINYKSSKVKPLTEHRDRLNMAIVLQNQMNYLAENTNTSVYGNSQPTAGVFSGDNYARGDARLPKVLIPMIRRTFCENITNEIVGVQPMSGPVGSAWALRFFYEPTALNATFRRVPTRTTSTVTATTRLGPRPTRPPDARTRRATM